MIRIKYGELSNMLPPYFQEKAPSQRDFGPFLRTGEIKGTYKNSLNIEFPPKEGEEGFFLHIGSLERPLCAYGISIEAKDMKKILTLCKEKSLVTIKKSGLLIYGEGEQFLLDVGNRNDFPVKDLRIWPKDEEGPEGAEKNKWLLSSAGRLLKEEVCGKNWKENMGIGWDEEFCRYTALLKREDCIGCPKIQTAVFGYFIGRGKGLTPAGDDILAGYGAVLAGAGRDGAREFALSLRRAAEGRTTDGSLAAYEAVSRGFVNEDFKELLACLSGRKGEDGRPVIETIKKTGHTSGHDTLFGAWLALEHLLNIRK